MLVFSFWRTNVDFDIVPDWNTGQLPPVLHDETYLRTFLKTLLMAALVTAAGLARPCHSRTSWSGT